MSEYGTDTPMTTPAHCGRADPHWSHPVHWVTNDLGIEWCPGVEPPADVAATPDSRLDVVAPLVHARVWADPSQGDFDESRDAAQRMG